MKGTPIGVPHFTLLVNRRAYESGDTQEELDNNPAISHAIARRGDPA